jgi:hypothetical protein
MEMSVEEYKPQRRVKIYVEQLNSIPENEAVKSDLKTTALCNLLHASSNLTDVASLNA